MANKRQLKQSINFACSELFAEGVAAYLVANKEEIPQIDDLLTTILKMHSDFVRRISHPEPGMKPKVYFKHLRDDFDNTLGELVEQIIALG